jgi:pimeloyl-ACP methyl ester carboxylesterase
MAPRAPPGRPPPSRRALLPGLAALAMAGCAASDAEAPRPRAPRGRVVLLRGLANIFSTGMDELEAKLQAAGYAATARNHLDWRDQAEEALALARAGRLPRPFAVIGHSLGADDGIRLAARVGQAVRMADLLVTFDPVLVGTVPPGPAFVRNYYQTTGVWGRGLEPARGFAGVLENRAVRSDNHFTIDKDPNLHREVLDMLEHLRARMARPAR